jgi:hypothetical protein
MRPLQNPQLCSRTALIKNKIKFSEIQNGAVAKSYVRKGFLRHEEMRKYLTIYEDWPLVKYDFATAPFSISLYMRKI